MSLLSNLSSGSSNSSSASFGSKSASSVDTAGGYSYRFVESGSYLKKLTCSLCGKVMRRPVKVEGCRHRFCDSCLHDYLSGGILRCPKDNQPLDFAKIYSDPDAEETIMSLSMKCIYHKSGCKWVDRMKNLELHLNTCQYNTVTCTNKCGSRVTKANLDQHLQFTCWKRKSQCDTCKHFFSNSELDSHIGNCPLEVVHCESKCGAKMHRRFLTNHTVNECPKRSMTCRFCEKSFVHETMQAHLHTCPRYPVSCPNRCDVTRSTSPSTTSSNSSINLSTSCNAKMAREELEAHLLECPSNAVPCQYYSVGCSFKGNKQKVEQHELESDRLHLSLACKVLVEQRDSIKQLESEVRLLRTCSPPPPPHTAALPHLPSSAAADGTLLWKIPNFSAKLETARNDNSSDHLVSPVFTTSRYGYRLQATLFPNGNGSGEGSHVSLYIRILPGEFDALLQWPFSRQISFTWYDQSQEKRQNITESFSPDPNWDNFQQPPPTDTQGPDDGLGFGFPQFISHETLRSRNYIRDNVVFVKVKVDYPRIQQQQQPQHVGSQQQLPLNQSLNDTFNKENHTLILTNIGS